MSSSTSSFHMFLFSFSIPILLLLLLLLLMSASMPPISAATTNKTSTKTSKNFIKSACNSTRYPKDCHKALFPHASIIKTDPCKLCYIALSVTINATYNASSSIESVSKMKGLSPSEKETIRDCAETTGDAIDELEKSLKEMANLQGSDRKDKIKNIRTWVSAALTDEFTCTDEFEGQKVSNFVKNTIKKRVLYLARLTSNCLALFNLLDSS